MRLDRKTFQSRLARRILGLFVASAMPPVLALSVLSLTTAKGRLVDQFELLRQQSKTEGLAIYERLLVAETESRRLANSLAEGDTGTALGAERFSFATFHLDDGDTRLVSSLPPSWVERHAIGALDLPETSDADDQRARILTVELLNGNGAIFILQRVHSARSAQGWLLARIRPEYLWWGVGAGQRAADGLDATPEAHLAPQTVLEVMDANGLYFLSTAGDGRPPNYFEREELEQARDSDRFRWSVANVRYRGSGWVLPLAIHFAGEPPAWTVVTGRTEAALLAPVTEQRNTTLLVMAIGLAAAMLLSIRLIRRTLLPFEAIHFATRRIAKGDFSPVTPPSSGDEVEELADSFNVMAKELDRRFRDMRSINEVARAALSELDTKRIVETVLTRIREVAPARAVGLTLFTHQDPVSMHFYSLDDTGFLTQKSGAEISLGELSNLETGPESHWLRSTEGVPPFLPSDSTTADSSMLVLTIRAGRLVHGVLVLDFGDEDRPRPHADKSLRPLMDQLAVALSNARLLERLERQNLGTVTALARAVDARSAWTSGHSERVARSAVRLGRALALDPDSLEVLRRGALLHDIGKIGLDTSLLDKPGPLTDDELQTIRRHVEIGVRILEEIPGFQDVLPILREHHEWYDGGGYPSGLAGPRINWLARIVAVADCFDALVSDRPYRRGLPVVEVLGYLKYGSGAQFDPRAVSAFIPLVEAGEIEGVGAADAPSVLRLEQPASPPAL